MEFEHPDLSEYRMLFGTHMIYHYVVQHHYLPPAEFVEALLASEHTEFSAPWVI